MKDNIGKIVREIEIDNNNSSVVSESRMIACDVACGETAKV